MDSIDPECTQLKHIYEACFQKWYTTEYLPTTEDNNIQSSSTDVTHRSTVGNNGNNNNKTSIFKSSTQPIKDTNAITSDQTRQKYKALAQSYETQCGSLFAVYRACLEKTLKSRKVDVMLAEHHLSEESNNKQS